MNERHIVLGVGEILWDLLPEGKQLGGATTNFAYHACQLGTNGYVVSSVGKDALGDEIVEIINNNGVGNLLSVDPEHATGIVEVELGERGIPTYNIIEGVAWDHIQVSDETLLRVRKADAVCFGSLAQRHSDSRESIRSILGAVPDDCIRVFDINLRQHFYNKDVIESSLFLADVLKINEEELVIVSNYFNLPKEEVDACDALLDKFDLRLVVLTRGENGSYLITRDELSYEETPEVKIADTVGAGDSFTATMVVGLLKGLPIPEIHKKAVNLSAYVCTQKGATPIIPEELKYQDS